MDRIEEVPSSARVVARTDVLVVGGGPAGFAAAMFVSPISGKVLAVNPHLDNHASIINEDPYSEGWLIEVRLNDSSELNELMDMDEYYHFVFKDTL